MRNNLVSVVLILVLLAGVGVVQAQGESSLPTPDPGDGGGEGGTVEVPEIEFDLTVMAVIIGLVEFMKQMGVSGRGSLGLSMGLGVVLGGSTWLATQGTPGDFGGWVVAGLAGLAYGLAASGLYDVGKKMGVGK